jgi:hypothetical protein
MFHAEITGLFKSKYLDLPKRIVEDENLKQLFKQEKE